MFSSASFLIVLFILAIGALLSIVIWSIRNGITPMPTSFKAKQAWLKALPPTVSGVIYELGAGWGTLLMPLALHYPHDRIVGFENSPIPYFVGRCRLSFKALKNVQFFRQDFFRADLSDAGLVVCYLYPEAMRRLKVKFEKELKPGTWVMSNTFAIPGWEPLQIFEVNDLYRTKIYLYRIESKEKS